jgi:hypothetical protein
MKSLGLSLTTVVLASFGLQAQTGSDWLLLFNRKTLAGWQVRHVPQDDVEGFWYVEDGAIVGNTMGKPAHDQVWLVHRQEFDNFELSLEFQAYRESPGNSGVQVRSRYNDHPDAPKGGWLNGPQVDIHPPTPWRTGMIYDGTWEERRWVSPSLPDWNMPDSLKPSDWVFYYNDEGSGWNELWIMCQGSRIKSELNGVVMQDFDGAGILDNAAHRVWEVGMNGHVALQLHVGDETLIRFRNIRLRLLDE